MCQEEKCLTKREKEIFEYIVKGMANKEISDALGISLETVKNHVKSILSKYGISDRKKLILMKYNDH